MRIDRQDYNNVTVLGLKGELDSDSVDNLHQSVGEVIASEKVGVVFDMSEVGFVDSSGLEKLLWARDYCNENQCQLRLAGLDENCSKILEITRLEKEFDRFTELTEAVKSFA